MPDNDSKTQPIEVEFDENEIDDDDAAADVDDETSEDAARAEGDDVEIADILAFEEERLRSWKRRSNALLAALRQHHPERDPHRRSEEESDQPRGASAKQPRGVSAKQPRGASGKQPRGVSGKQPRGVSGKQPRGVSVKQPRGVSEKAPRGVTRKMSCGVIGMTSGNVIASPPLQPVSNTVMRAAHVLVDSAERRAGRGDTETFPGFEIARIKRTVCRHYAVTMSDLVSPRRQAGLVRARQVAMYVAKVITARSFPEVGRHFGDRDHTTVLHAVRKIEADLESYREEIAAICDALR